MQVWIVTTIHSILTEPQHLSEYLQNVSISKTLNTNKKKKKIWKGFSVFLNRFELDDVSDLKIIGKIILKLLMSLRVSKKYSVKIYSICCLTEHMFKAVQWCNTKNTNMMPRRNSRNLSLAYPNIYVRSWYEATGMMHIQNPIKYLRWKILQK